MTTRVQAAGDALKGGTPCPAHRHSWACLPQAASVRCCVAAATDAAGKRGAVAHADRYRVAVAAAEQGAEIGVVALAPAVPARKEGWPLARGGQANGTGKMALLPFWDPSVLGPRPSATGAHGGGVRGSRFAGKLTARRPEGQNCGCHVAHHLDVA